MLLLAFFASGEAVAQSLSSPLDADRIPVCSPFYFFTGPLEVDRPISHAYHT